MSQFEQHTPEGHGDEALWRKVFDEAAETPPPRVWDTIEQRLDETDGPKVVPLWGSGWATSRPVVWGVGLAAAVALLLIGWWAIQQPEMPATQVAQQSTKVKPQPNAATQQQAETATASSVEPNAPTVARNSSDQREPSVGIAAEQSTERGRVLSKRAERVAEAKETSRPPVGLVAPRDADIAYDQRQERIHEQVAESQPNAVTRTSITSTASPTSSVVASEEIQAVSDQLDAMPPAVQSVDQLAIRPMQFKQLYGTQRMVWFRAPEPEFKPGAKQSITRSREVWASVSVAPGAFNPMVSVQSTSQPILALASNNKNTFVQNAPAYDRPAVNSKADFSIAYQASAGVQLNQRWSFETGVGYLAGRSTVETPTQLAVTAFRDASIATAANADYSSNTANLYIDALRNSSQRTEGLANDVIPSSNNVYAYNASVGRSSNIYDQQTRQSLTNDYLYVQLPIQVGYQLRPQKRLSFAVLGGFLTNWFVRNNVADQLTISRRDGVYRPVSLAASMGLRFRYRPTRRWSASLAGMYQPSLQSGTQPASQVQSRPTSTGMSFGVDYHF